MYITLKLMELHQVAKLMETLHLLGALLIYLLSPTLQPPSPLISAATKTKKCSKLKQSTLKGERGGEVGKVELLDTAGIGSYKRCFFNRSPSTILQFVVA